MESKANATIKLFGVEICVEKNEEIHNSPTPSESSTPAGSPSTVLSHNDDQQKRVAESSHVAAADEVVPAAHVITGSRPSSDDVSTKSPAKKSKGVLEQFHGFDIINNGFMVYNNNPMRQPLMATEFGLPRGLITNFAANFSRTDQKGDNKSQSGLSPNYDLNDAVSRKSLTKKRLFHEIHDPLLPSSSIDRGILLQNNHVYYPIPLSSIPPANPQHVRAQLGVSATNDRHQVISPNSCENKKKAKLSDYENHNSESVPKRRRRNTINNTGADLELPLIPPPADVLPLEEIPRLLQIIESHNGSKPVFLYKKKLEESDVRAHNNRLFVIEPGNLMGFLREEEKTAVIAEKGKGVEFIGIDKKGELFELHMAKWPSLKMIIINKGWTTIISANDAQKGDLVEIWGYRVNNDELRLVLNFRKQEETQEMNAAGSSGTSNNS